MNCTLTLRVTLGNIRLFMAPHGYDSTMTMTIGGTAGMPQSLAMQVGYEDTNARQAPQSQRQPHTQPQFIQKKTTSHTCARVLTNAYLYTTYVSFLCEMTPALSSKKYANIAAFVIFRPHLTGYLFVCVNVLCECVRARARKRVCAKSCL
jgi:hypothetical protein